MKKTTATLLFLFFICGVLYCQKKTYTTQNKKAIKLYQEAADYYNANQNSKAIELLKKAIREDSTFVEAQGMLGYIYDDMGDDSDAIVQYNAVIRINPSFHPDIYLSAGRLELETEHYAIAKQHLQLFMEYGDKDPEMLTDAANMLADCDFAVEAIQHPVPFNPVNMGTAINTRVDEYYPTITEDGSMLIFTRQLEYGHPDWGARNYNEDLYVSFKENGEWTEALNMGSQINTDAMDGAPSISADGNLLIFASDRPGGYGDQDLYYSFRVGNEWSQPRNMGPPINTRNWETQPCLASDERTLYFVRGKVVGHKVEQQDIYETILSDSGTWGIPVRLSDTINTPGIEEWPCIAPDNQTLYFASNGHPGFGGLDLFMSRKLPNGRWDIPVNLGYPINTSKDETGIALDPDGKLAYFSSDRPGGYGKMDIYSFLLPDSLRPQPVTYMKGKVYDATTNQPLIAYFTLIDLNTGKVISESTSRPIDGTFLVCLPVNKNYALNVSKHGYLFYSENFSLKNVKASYEHPYLKNVPLQPIDTGASIVLKNIFFETNKYDLKPESEVELGKLIAFLKNNPTIKIEISGHTDNQGTPQSNIILSENRAKAVYDYLIAHSIDANRLTYKGYGQTRPIATNDTPEGRQLNRRTEMKITAK